jgi:ectoine hydroxylase-related dioxygenase (phytanoyl-CoA dioxygenase family)
MTATTPNSSNADGVAVSRFGPEMVERFRDQGFLIVPNFLTQPELESLRELYDGIVSQVTKYYLSKSTETEEERTKRRAKGYMIPINRPEEICPQLLETAAYHKARYFVAEMTDTDPKRLGVHGRIWHKPAEVGLPTPWHQDEPTFGRRDILVSATVSVVLDDTSQENGCLNYLPLSFNKHENLPHIMREQGVPAGHTGTETYYEIDPEQVDARLAVSAGTLAGGATIHHARTVHGAGWNRSSKPRRSLCIRYSLHAGD